METEDRKVRDFSVVGFLLRFPLGVLFFFAGLGKFVGGYDKFVAWILKDMTEKTWLPKALLYPYAYTLPFVEVVVGILLIVGLFTRPVLVFTALLLTSLMFGKILTQEHATVAQNAGYVFMAAAAYYFSRHNCFSLDALLKKNPGVGSQESE